MKRLLSLTFLILSALAAAAQGRYRITGVIIDGYSGDPIAGAAVYPKDNPPAGSATDPEGRFVIFLPSGPHTLLCGSLGYESLEVSVDEYTQGELLIRMKPLSSTIDEIIVSSKSSMERVENVQIGVEKIEMAEMARVPALFGERDMIRAIQLLPGIKSEGEGSGGYQVRGGTADQNLILLDDATVYNSGHLMGVFSAFNDDALINASLYKGQIPAQFGGATSSVFDIHTKSGDMQRYKVDGSVGLLSAKINVEGPFARDKASFFVAARRTYLDLFLKATNEYKNTTLNFYDINAKVNYNITERDKLFVSFFTGRDNMALEDLMDMKWGNTAATIRWFHRYNDRLHSNTSVVLSSYKADSGIEILDIDYSFDSFIKHSGLRQYFTWSPNGKHDVKFGFHSVYLGLKSAEWNMNNYHEKEERNAWENTFWINEEWKVTDRFSVSGGLRFNIFSALGGSPYYTIDENGEILEKLEYGSGKIVKSHFTLEPRMSANYRISGLTSIKAGYSRTSQNIHALRNESMSMPFDRYTLSSNIVKPQAAHQASLGYMALTGNRKYEFSIEGYYKTIDNVLDYKDGKSFSSEIEIERLILPGKGRAYGVELYARRNEGRLTGWVAYTLSWSRNKIPGINNGKWYTAGNDRRHDISVVGMYELPRGWHAAATWVYNTGQALTAPSAKYELNGQTVYYYAERNGYRAPDYHRLDISATHTKTKRRYTREWTFGIYNVYNRYNPYIITFEDDDTKPSGTKTVQTSLFGLIPSVSYSFKF